MTTKLTSSNVGTVKDFTVSWQSVITADGSTTTNVEAGKGYFIDTTSAAHTVTLPASATIGDIIHIKDYAGTFGTNNLTILRNGHNIQGVANDSLISTNRASISLFYIDSTKGWLYRDESNVGDLQGPFYITATGGTETTDGNFKIHTFTGDGCFSVSSLGGGSAPCAEASTVDYLVVAGGGGGGYWYGAGGGGGGYRESKDSSLASPHSASPIVSSTGLTVTATTYPVTVGAGGPSSTDAIRGPGTQGSNSVFSTITSAGGGYGGGSEPTGAPGGSGGSGGGGGGSGSSSAGTGNTPPVSPSQGNPGGSSGPVSGAGGGGAISAGGANPGPSTGGNGATTSISGSSSSYSGGGSGVGGGTSTGGSAYAASGSANTGAGAGGDNGGGAGGKGIVIIRYKYQ
jgi:hypothetical protein